MARQRNEVDFLPHAEIDNRSHDRAEQNMHVRSNPLLPQSRLKSFKVTPGILADTLEYLWIQGRNGISHVYRRKNRLHNLKQYHLRLAISAGKIFNVRNDLFRPFGPIQGY